MPVNNPEGYGKDEVKQGFVESIDEVRDYADAMVHNKDED